MWRKSVFDIYFTEYGTAFDNYFTYFVPVFKYCYVVTAGTFEP